MFEKWVKSSFSIATIDEDSENCCIHVHVHVLHDICEEEIIFHEVSRQPCCLPICPFKKNASSQIGKWKRQCLANERWERIHQISFTVPSTLISHWSWTLYILKLGGVNWLVTNQNSWIPYPTQTQYPSFSCQCSICKKQLSDFHSI